MHLNIQRAQLFDVLFAFGLDHRANEAHPRGVAADGDLAFVFWLGELGKILRHVGGAN